MMSGTAGMNADPSCKRQAIEGMRYKIKFAVNPLEDCQQSSNDKYTPPGGNLQENTKSHPELPTHDEAAANRSR